MDDIDATPPCCHSKEGGKHVILGTKPTALDVGTLMQYKLEIASWRQIGNETPYETMLNRRGSSVRGALSAGRAKDITLQAADGRWTLRARETCHQECMRSMRAAVVGLQHAIEIA